MIHDDLLMGQHLIVSKNILTFITRSRSQSESIDFLFVARLDLFLASFENI